MVLLLVIAGYFFFKTSYKAPTCFDGVMNGNEQGVDCGGSCQRLCQSAFLEPMIAWTSVEQLASGSYNAAAYIINPNNEGEAYDVPYHFVLFDAQGGQIIDTPGTVHIPPHRNTLAFLGPIPVGKRIPYKAFFEFVGAPNWQKSADTLSPLSITEKKYTEDKFGSSLLVTIKNTNVKPIKKMSVFVALSDAGGNVIGFSKTVVDGIVGLSSIQAPFTWPTNRNGKVVSIEVLPVAE